MGAFRKRSDIGYVLPSCPPPTIDVVQTKSVLIEGTNVPTTIVSYVKKSVSDYAEQLMLPCDEDYKLQDMIASGNIPQEVPVAGILDSNDPCDISNVGVTESLFNKLSSEVDNKVSEPSSSPSAAEPSSNS